MHDYDVQRCSRHCVATGRELADGEVFYSALLARGAALERQDFAAEAWQGPPEGVLAWWRARVPARDARPPRLAPSDVLLTLLDGLEQHPDRAELRYVLALLLVRRRVLRVEEQSPQAAGETIELYCPRQDRTHHVRVALPAADRAEALEQELAELLSAGAA
jgi:hypothetical protein